MITEQLEAELGKEYGLGEWNLDYCGVHLTSSGEEKHRFIAQQGGGRIIHHAVPLGSLKITDRASAMDLSKSSPEILTFIKDGIYYFKIERIHQDTMQGGQT